MIRKLALAAVLPLLCLTSCATNQQTSSADRPHATVLMRDGTKITGAVLSNSSDEIKIAGDDNVTHTIPTAQVKSIEYGEAPAPKIAAKKPQGDTPAAAPSPTAQAEPDQGHANHPHAAESAITTKTFELPIGTEVSVRTEESIDSGKAVEGQTFAAEVTKDVLDAAGATVIPRCANAQIVIRSASKGGRFRGASDLVLDLQSVAIEGQQ